MSAIHYKRPVTRQGFSYAQAVVLLGGRQSRTVVAIDRLVGGALLAAMAPGAGYVLDLLNAKSELVRLSNELLAGIGERLRGLRRFDRTERLAAAHAVVVVTAFFEALDELSLPFDVAELRLTADDKAGLSLRGRANHQAMLLQVDVGLPAPHRPYDENLAALTEFYQHVTLEIRTLVAGLAVWDRLDDRERRRWRKATDELPRAATRRYEELFRRLAVECPELGFWANLVDHQATRAEIRRLATGLAGMERVLAEIAHGRAPDVRRLALARAYQAELHRPILTTVQDQNRPRIPTLGDAYIDPTYRVAHNFRSDHVATEERWNEVPIRDDLQEFMLGYLTSPHAIDAPLLLLGQPGSGKSVFTKVLAARLPPSDFLTVRVALREVPADADLQTQIEHAICAATGERLTWTELARSAGDALPVVLLDGFDELLQATGASQSDYLERVAAFQQREADQGRPVAVLVTSRTAVADRARSVYGSVAVRLEPFGDRQIERWLEVWNFANAGWLADRGLLPLSTHLLGNHRELASQPLLLLMLALYDADGNQLQNTDAALGTADIYERLLIQFAEREVRKAGAALSDEQCALAVDRELTRLSIVALAMFNRHRQWVTEVELDDDLAALLDEEVSRREPTGLRAELTPAQIVIGRFFFVHQAQALRDNRRLRTYEFLHATFGEYLVGRIVVAELVELAEAVKLRSARRKSAVAGDEFLYTLLSFAPLTMRATISVFANELLGRLAMPQRERVRDLLLTLFRCSLKHRRAGEYDGYLPDRVSAPARAAAYSANIVLLAVLAEWRIRAQDLYPDSPDPVTDWRSLVLLWQSQLPATGWSGLLKQIRVERYWCEGRREVRLARLPSVRNHYQQQIDPYWANGYGPGNDIRPKHSGESRSWRELDILELLDEHKWHCDPGGDALVHAIEPLFLNMGEAVVTFQDWYGSPDGAVSAANALVNMWLAVSQDSPSTPQRLAASFDKCIRFAIEGFDPRTIDEKRWFGGMVLRQLAMNRHRLPKEWLDSCCERIRAAANENSAEGLQLFDLAHEIVPWALGS